MLSTKAEHDDAQGGRVQKDHEYFQTESRAKRLAYELEETQRRYMFAQEDRDIERSRQKKFLIRDSVKGNIGGASTKLNEYT